VFVIGDAAYFLGADGKPLPGVSPTAMQMGRHVARIIRVSLARGPARFDDALGGKSERQPFHYRDKGSMATIGRSRAVAEMGKLKLTGFLAWLAWLFVHIWYLIGFRNRLLVFFDWSWSYLTFRRGARLITGGRMEPGAPTRDNLPDGQSRLSMSEAEAAAGVQRP
jgi:NADH dehydrogenase